jgi:hypothetical protein
VFPALPPFGVHHGRRIAAYQAERGPVVPALLAAGHPSWPDHLASFVRSVRADDFDVAADGAATPLEESLDLVAVGRTR